MSTDVEGRYSTMAEVFQIKHQQKMRCFNILKEPHIKQGMLCHCIKFRLLILDNLYEELSTILLFTSF